MLRKVCEDGFRGEFDHDKLMKHHCTEFDLERAALQHCDVCKIFGMSFAICGQETISITK